MWSHIKCNRNGRTELTILYYSMFRNCISILIIIEMLIFHTCNNIITSKSAETHIKFSNRMTLQKLVLNGCPIQWYSSVCLRSTTN